MRGARASLKKASSKYEEKIALADSKKYKAMEKATQSEIQVLALSLQYNDLSVKLTTREVDHNLELIIPRKILHG